MKKKLLISACLFFLLLIFSLQVILSARVKSATSDEDAYLKAGEKLSEARRWNDRDTVKHPPLTYYIHGFALKPFTFATPEEHLFYARVCMLPFGLVLGFFIFKWAREACGTKGAFFALFLFAFSPNLIAHSRWITTDVPFAAMSFAATYYLWKSFKEEKIPYVIACGIFLGLALLTKYSAVLFIPIYLITGLGVFLVKWKSPAENKPSRRKRILQIACYLLAIFVLATLIVNIGYVFTGSFTAPADYNFWTGALGALSRTPVLKSIPLPFPYPFVQGIDLQMNITEKGHPAYLWGMHSIRGWWYFYIVAFLVKVPVPMILGLALSFVLYRKNEADRLTKLFILVPAAFGFIYVSFFSRLQLGLRYIFFIFPYLYLWMSFLAEDFRNRRYLRYALIFLAVWYAGGTLRMYPDYLSFFNELAGGPEKGYKYLVDSDLSWTQDRDFVESYFEQPQVEVKGLPGPLPTTGYIAAGVGYLQNFLGVEDEYAWLRRFEPYAFPSYTNEGWLGFIKPYKRAAYSCPIFLLTEEDFERDVELHPDNAQAHSSMGWIHWEKGDVKQGIESQMKALSCKEDFAPAYCALGIYYLDLGEYEKARYNLEKAIEPGKGSYILPYNLLPLVPLYENNEKEFERLHREYVVAKNVNANEVKLEGLTENAAPANADAVLLNNIGAACWAKGNPERAMEYFNRAIAKEPRFEEALHNLAVLYYESGDLRTGNELNMRAQKTLGSRGATVAVSLGHFRVTSDAFKIMTIGAKIPYDNDELKRSEAAYVRACNFLLREFTEGGDISLVIKHAYGFTQIRPQAFSYLYLASALKSKKLFRKAHRVLAEGLEKNPNSLEIRGELEKLKIYGDGESASGKKMPSL